MSKIFFKTKLWLSTAESVFEIKRNRFVSTKLICFRTSLLCLLIWFKIVTMFSLNFSYLCILREVARRCCLPYVACIHEIGDGGEHIYGIEVELTANVVQTTSKTLFFWAQDALHDNFAYEAAALQTLIVLQTVYGFLVIDYSVHGLQLYRDLAHYLFPVANRGAQLARLVVAASNEDSVSFLDVAMFAQQLLDELTC